MEYVNVEQARQMPGLRLVLTAGQPGPWGEAAKALFRIKGISYTAVRQEAGASNDALRDWTGHSNAPIAMLDDDAPRSHWLELIMLAERLSDTPRLVPEDGEQRVRMIGLTAELAGEDGLGWQRRLLIFHSMMGSDQGRELVGAMAQRYGYSDQAAQRARRRCAEILRLLSAQMRSQLEAGRRFLIGGQLSALDVYWAAFSNMVWPLAEECCPMPAGTRAAYTLQDEQILAAADESLRAHRDRVLQEHGLLPMVV